MKNMCILICALCLSIVCAAESPKPSTSEQYLALVPRSSLAQLRVMKQGYGNAVLYPVKIGTAQYLAVNANLGSAFDAVNMDSVQVSADGYHYAAVVTIKGKQCVIVDGKPGALYASILPDSLVLENGGGSVSYFAKETSGQTRRVLVDLREGGIYPSAAFDEIRPHSAFSAPKGLASAYIARIGKQWCAVMLNKPGKLYDDIGHAAFSQDGKYLYFTSLIDGKWKLVSPRTHTALLYAYDEIGPLVVSPDNQSIMYAVRVGDHWNIIRYSELVFPDGVAELSIIGADGRELHRLKYIPKVKRPPVEQALTQQPFDAVGGYGFLADGTFLYTAKRGAQWSLLVCGDTIDGPYENLEAPLFDAKRNQVFCTAQQHGQWYLLAGAKKYGPYEAVGPISFSPKGDHVVYAAKKAGQWCISVDGVDGEGYAAVDAPVWSPDGARMAYVAKIGEQYGVILDGKIGKRYDAVSQPSFSRSGREIAFAARNGEKWRAVVGQYESTPYDLIIGSSVVINQEAEKPQAALGGTAYSPLVFHYLAARISAKRLNNEEAYDMYFVKEMRFE